MAQNGESWASVEVNAGEVRIHCAVAGPERGERVILLHGFPECGRSWHEAGARLAREGYRVIVPDMRGYGGSDKPRGVEPYGVEHLVGDVASIVEKLASGRAHIVGHDWGGVVAWWTAMLRPDVVDCLGIVNAPHPVGYGAAMRTPAQLLRGWYVLLFQVPLFPEWLLGFHDYAAVRGVFARDDIAESHIDPCIASIRQPGARSAALGYYRAAMRGQISGTAPRPRTIDKRVLVVWGEKDRFLVPALASPPERWVPRTRIVRLPDATHWAHIDAVDPVVHALVSHFREETSPLS